ncbi:MAG: LAGLIDADG family homing endonuclease [Candidatus Nanohaloarchaea archaeon]
MTNVQQKTSFKLPVKRVTGETVEERLTENAHDRILPARYLLKDEEGNTVETPKEMFERVAKNVAQPDKEYDDIDYEDSWQEFYGMMSNLEFMPNSPTLMNAGAELQQLSACFVVHPEDDMDSIFNKVHDAAKIFQSGGGMGYPFHLMRPKGDIVKSTGGIASGPLSFQQVFDTMCGTIKQGGKRRGAQMGIMRVDHPDILRFIVSKRKEGNLSNFNISVGLTEDFMEAVKNDEEFELINPRTEESFEVSRKTAQFYNSDEEWYPEAAGSDQGKDDNFWRDFSATFSDEVNEYDIDLEVGEKMTLPARFIWECLVDGAWRNGEPGLFMYDETNDQHSIDVEEHPEHRIEATNPCVTGDSLISTEQGIFTAEELYEQRIATDIVVDSRLSDEKIKEASSVYKTGTKDVYRLETEEGFELRLTEDHRVMTEKGWKEARELEEDDEVHILDREGSFGRGGTLEEGRVLGWLVGDGQMKESEERAVLHFYDEDSEITSEFASDVNKIVRSPEGNADYEIGVQEISRREGHRQKLEAKEQRVRSKRLCELAEEYGLAEEKLQVPEKVFRSGEQLARGFLQGLFTADGSVQGTTEKGVQVRLSSSDEELLKETQQLLLNFGIYSKIYTERREEGSKEMPDGKGGIREYDIKAQHDLAISKENLEKFRQKIGFLREDKNQELEQKLSNYTRGPYQEKRTATVEYVEKDGHEDVYDLTEPETHSFVANGIVVHNCGEQPLENYEACNLGHINLSLLVEDQGDGMGLDWRQWTSENAGEYDFSSQEGLEEAMSDYLQEALRMDKFEEIAKKGTRFLDNVVTMSDFPLEEIEEKVSSMRKIGLGLMGFAQMLIQLGIEYGSDESIVAAKEIQRMITHFSVEESHRLAKVRGEFDHYEKSKWANPTEYSEWFRKYSGGMDPEEYEGGLKVRNHNMVTIAPTGTTSMIGNTSGGCEPIYQVAYFKNVAKDIQGEDMLVEFDDYFIRALEANDIDIEEVKQEVENLMRNNEWQGVQSLDDEVLPPAIKEIFKTSDQVTPEEHVRIQAAFQQHNHSGISKTCNFPNEATREDVREAYMLAYDLGIKGMTVYRDGTRDVQVMQQNQENTVTDMDTVDAIAELVEEQGGVQEFLSSEEFVEATGIEEEAGLQIIEKESQADGAEADLNEDVTQENVEAEPAQAEPSGTVKHTKMGNGARERPKMISGTTQEIETAYGDLFVTVNEDDEGVFEVFANLGKSGGYTESFTQALGRSISLALRTGASAEDVVNQLDDIRSPQIAWDQGTQIHSVPDAIAEAMKRHLRGGSTPQQTVDNFSESPGKTQAKTEQEQKADSAKIIANGGNPECPECGGMLILEEGCNKCPDCGFSKC